MRRARLVFAGAALLALAASSCPSTARADDAQSAERLRSAAAEFDAGRRAYLAGEFSSAAVHFENAYHDAPRAESLRSAIRARRAARQLARAASLAAVARARYGSDAPTVALATEVLDEAAPVLHEVRIACTPECGIAADGRALSLDDATSFRLFVDAGRHEVTVSWPVDRSTRLAVDARAGGKDAFTLTAPPEGPRASATAPAAIAVPLPRDTSLPSRKPLPPVVFVVGAALTAVGVGTTIVSGVDTLNNPGADAVRAKCVGLGEACPEYQQGRDAQRRTNVLLVTTGGLFAATAIMGLFFTQWSQPSTASPRRAALQLRPVPAFTSGGAGVSVVGVF